MRWLNSPRVLGLAAICAAISPAAVSLATADDFQSMRPVPQVRTSTILSSGSQAGAAPSSPTRRPGWNLQWRTSPSIQRDKARQISDQAFAAAQPTLQEQAEPSQLIPAPVARASWLTQPTASTIQPTASTIQLTQAESPATPPGRSGMSLPGFDELPMPQPEQQQQPALPNSELPSPQLSSPSTQSGGATKDWFDNPFRDEPNGKAGPGTGQAPRAFEELPLPTDPQPEPAAPADDSSIRDMLQDAPAPAPTPEPAEQPQTGEPNSLPAPQNGMGDLEESPSDRELFDSNPFNRRDNDQREQEQRDRMGLGDEETNRFDRERDEDRSSFFDDQRNDEISRGGVGLTCEEFRSRIAASTIDQVSLDISPPFRPDVIDEKEYQKLKGRFDTEQDVRTWRSIDGRELGTGRLTDLAYEKAVIVTEFGTEEELPLNRISEADLAYISENWGLPTECLIEQVAFTPRRWQPTTMVYAASNLCHKPLYFEEVNLERYGHTAGPLAQPLISSAHFFVNIAVLPYKMGVHSPHECQYALGYYRPGNCAPWIIPPVPLSVKGAWYQAAAITGTALLVP